MVATQVVAKHIDRFATGQVVFGGYRILEVIGFGKTSTVYSCRRLADSQFVALKVLTRAAAGDERLAQRFRNELFIAYQIRHPNVVRGFEFVHSREGEAFTMEYANGGTLAEALRKTPKFSLANALSVLEQLCRGLAAIHEAGMVHRDLKPENVLFSESGEVKICDFNAAVSHVSGRHEWDRGVIGTPPYISPEVLLTGRADSRSDIYALGAVAYFLLAGRPPFEDENEARVEADTISRRPVDPRKLNRECPRKLNRIIQRALDKNPEKRQQTAAELLAEIESIAR